MVNPFISIILGVVSAMFLIAFLAVCRKIVQRHTARRIEGTGAISFAQFLAQQRASILEHVLLVSQRRRRPVRVAPTRAAAPGMYPELILNALLYTGFRPA